MFGAKSDTGHHNGQVRYANAIYDYTPNFSPGSHTEGLINETDLHVTSSFRTPSARPTKAQAAAYESNGTVRLAPPPGTTATHLYAASWNASGNPPTSSKYQIDYSTDDGQTWNSVVKDWQIIRRPPEPNDFWS